MTQPIKKSEVFPEGDNLDFLYGLINTRLSNKHFTYDIRDIRLFVRNRTISAEDAVKTIIAKYESTGWKVTRQTGDDVRERISWDYLQF